MYSRRLLISNYNTYFQTNEAKTSILKEPITNQKFHILENEYGTVIYPKEPMNALELREKDNVLFNLINTSFINIEDIFEIIQDTTNLKNKYPYEYLSQKETRIKAKEEE